jgi:hypothetical protein
MCTVEAERVAHCLHLADEQLDRPEVGRLLDPRRAAADLVVEDHAPAGAANASSGSR